MDGGQVDGWCLIDPEAPGPPGRLAAVFPEGGCATSPLPVSQCPVLLTSTVGNRAMQRVRRIIDASPPEKLLTFNRQVPVRYTTRRHRHLIHHNAQRTDLCSRSSRTYLQTDREGSGIQCYSSI